MKKIKHRTVAAVILICALLAGLIFFLIKYAKDGESWATFSANRNVYSDGVLVTGTVLDRNGVVLSTVEDNTRTFADDYTLRKSTLHVVGDAYGNIGTGALSAFSSELIGYNILSGTYSLSGKGNSLYLTIDSELNETAYNALDGRSGTVAVYNYETGEILCLVSSPSVDVVTESVSPDDTSGIYINRFISSSFTPGSIFKIVTTAAAIENISDIYDRTFICNGSFDVNGDSITCTGTHGEITFQEAMAYSCNCAYGEMALELGSDTLEKYAERLGLLESFSINGIETASGKFEKAGAGTADLAWSGIGQYTDLVNPASFLRLMGAVANGGTAVEPTLIADVKNNMGISTGVYPKKSAENLLSTDTANKISDMMSYNVYQTYGADNYPGLNLHAKSGTAEVGSDLAPHAWFVGFITNSDHPLAFVVLVENGGGGSSAAGAVANTVLQAAIAK